MYLFDLMCVVTLGMIKMNERGVESVETIIISEICGYYESEKGHEHFFFVKWREFIWVRGILKLTCIVKRRE